MTSSFRAVLDAAEPRPALEDLRGPKKNYAERLSRHTALFVADALRSDFAGILPASDGSQHESPARTAKGVKKLDVNYSTLQLGLGLGVSIKTINFRDGKSKRYTKNFTRADAELRAEAIDYHERQPYAVLIGLVLLPVDACDDGRPGSSIPSSFGAAVKLFRHRAGRSSPRDDPQLFERLFIGLYAHEGDERGDLTIFDVAQAPPRSGRPNPVAAWSFSAFCESVRWTYDMRNDPPFQWADE